MREPIHVLCDITSAIDTLTGLYVYISDTLLLHLLLDLLDQLGDSLEQIRNETYISDLENGSLFERPKTCISRDALHSLPYMTYLWILVDRDDGL